MTLWKAFLAFGFLLLILELISPATFFLSLAIGSFVTGICAVFVHSFNILVPVFVVVSILSLLLFRPFLRDNLKSKDESGIDEKYIGKTANVLEKVTKFSGVISIYGERWEARSINGQEIEPNSEVKIIKNESLIMYVEKI